MEGAGPLFQMEGISKSYGGVRALQDASLSIRAGTIHAILGENGAGKSTLIKVMAGVVSPDQGQMMLGGNPVQFASPAAAMEAGIACVVQELSLIPELSVADNVVISNPPQRFGLIDRTAQRRIAEQSLLRAGAGDVHPMALVKDLPLSRRQMVEIAKALTRKPRILILDEATSALTASDVSKVFEVLKRLRSEGLALLYISHRMNEIAELADECTVFRNGRNVASFPAGTKSDGEVVQLMIGREYQNVYPEKPTAQADAKPLLEVQNLSWANRLHDISFGVKPGEILGLGGLDGQGQRELLLALFGVLRGLEGEVKIEGKATKLDSPASARKKNVGMALIPEDRKTEGLMLPMSVRDNLSFASLDMLTVRGIVDKTKEAQSIDEMVKLLAIKTGALDSPVSSLSGGNQQKVVIAKWLMRHPRIILLNDPTRGIDVGTKQEIYLLMRRLADQGAAIVFYSTDYAELIGCCDRVLVMYNGAVETELLGDEITEHALISSALHIRPKENQPRERVSR
ncbi:MULTISPECIES: sugar ABC transporter ATP-binding protein [Mesorhizobium]|uniref:Sugar ABC transporter ATP-binding protein n=1 Tax=Mesorhizobium denitrificans TaxID=2294114 RepID=A0A371X3Z0_9HYPH|nr:MULTISPECIES: sugar ABC transporter ATP-binding protein [Mesorhizobium]RFC63919.1 sugar ABC transporter ATP-binding protein [Mesorhizobium denitrificans]